MRVTLKDIVNKTGVSRSVVSMYLNRDPRVRLSEEKKKRIDEAVRELGYRPSIAARSLRKGQTKLIGLVLGGILDPFFAHFAEAALTFAEDRGYQILCVLTSWDKKKEELSLETLIDRQVDAILYSPELTADPVFMDKIRHCGIPILQKTAKDEKLLYSGVQNMIPQVIKFLIDRGHKEIGYVGFRNPDFRTECKKQSVSGIPFFYRKNVSEIMEDIMERRPPALYAGVCRIAGAILQEIKKNGLDYSPEIVTHYNFPIDIVEEPEVVGFIYGDFYRYMKRTMDFLIDHIESKNGMEKEKSIITERHLYSREEFFRIRESLTDTLEKAKQQIERDLL